MEGSGRVRGSQHDVAPSVCLLSWSSFALAVGAAVNRNKKKMKKLGGAKRKALAARIFRLQFLSAVTALKATGEQISDPRKQDSFVSFVQQQDSRTPQQEGSAKTRARRNSDYYCCCYCPLPSPVCALKLAC